MVAKNVSLFPNAWFSALMSRVNGLVSIEVSGGGQPTTSPRLAP